jgi:hypothetical protein
VKDANAVVDRHSDLLGKDDEREQICEQQRDMVADRSDFQSMILDAVMLSHGFTGIGQNEVVAVANVLDREKHAVQPGRHDWEYCFPLAVERHLPLSREAGSAPNAKHTSSLLWAVAGIIKELIAFSLGQPSKVLREC